MWLPGWEVWGPARYPRVLSGSFRVWVQAAEPSLAPAASAAHRQVLVPTGGPRRLPDKHGLEHCRAVPPLNLDVTPMQRSRELPVAFNTFRFCFNEQNQLQLLAAEPRDRQAVRPTQHLPPLLAAPLPRDLGGGQEQSKRVILSIALVATTGLGPRSSMAVCSWVSCLASL